VVGIVKEQANCRYGSGAAYLYANGLYAGYKVLAYGRNRAGTWIWVKPPYLNFNCWVALSLVDYPGDPSTLPIVQNRLPFATKLYTPPPYVKAERQGEYVDITWTPVNMTKDDDRGYLIEGEMCQGGQMVEVAVHAEEPPARVLDSGGCKGKSWARIYTVEKHGYTLWLKINWP
jgi:hypothetical protein